VINFLKREGIGMFQIDGVVKINGEVIPHFMNGVYGKILDDAEDGPVTFEIETSTGQTGSFTVVPTAPIKIKSINGKSEGYEIDMTQDLVLNSITPMVPKPRQCALPCLPTRSARALSTTWEFSVRATDW